MIRDQIINIARKELGTKESPAGSNMQKYGAWFGLNGVAWCGIFCSWCYAMAGQMIRNGGYLKGFAGVATILTAYRTKITIKPQAADLVIFDWNADKKPDHVALFVEWIDKENFKTIEGNTTMVGNQSDGGEVMERSRSIKNVVAFINILG